MADDIIPIPGMFGPGSGAHYNLDILSSLPPSEPREESDTVKALRVELGLDRCKLRPYEHQVIGIKALVDNPFFALFDEMGAGKTIQTLVAAQLLFLAGTIDRVIILAPASVRSVWFDPDLGEIRKHLFVDHYAVTEFHAKSRFWKSEGFTLAKRSLDIIVTNYEFVGRSRPRLMQLLANANARTLLVLDESSAAKNYRASQTKACFLLRQRCGRVVLLNGTPISNNPLDMFTQGNLLHPKVLECKFITHYRGRYAVMEAHDRNYPKITGWKNLDDLQRRFAPFVLRRLKKDCLDLPDKLPPITLEVPMTEATWAVYREMRDQMVVWLEGSSVSVAAHAITKVMRLAQITSGFLGGLEEDVEPGAETSDAPSFVEAEGLPFEGPITRQPFTGPIREIGREKLDLFLGRFEEWLDVDPALKLLTFGRFKPEVYRMLAEVRAKFPHVECGLLVGGQKESERAASKRLLDPRTAPAGPALVVGTYGTGSKGHTFTAAHTILNVSYDYSMEKFLQSGDRIHRPGQTHPCSFFDVVATGPRGQKTIDHHIILSRRGKINVADYTASAWVRALREE